LILQHVDRVHLEIAVEEIVTVSTSHVIQDTAHALLVDVKVDIPIPHFISCPGFLPGLHPFVSVHTPFSLSHESNRHPSHDSSQL
jgi:hypothetical protein